jgi:hypothetical protein
VLVRRAGAELADQGNGDRSNGADGISVREVLLSKDENADPVSGIERVGSLDGCRIGSARSEQGRGRGEREVRGFQPWDLAVPLQPASPLANTESTSTKVLAMTATRHGVI